MPKHVLVQSGRSAGAVFPLRPGANPIGRAAGNAMVLDDDKVSATHARIEMGDGVATLADLDSTNGTRLNGEPVGPPARLQPRDVIQVGNTLLVYDDGDLPAESSTRKVHVVFDAAEERPFLTVAWADERPTEPVHADTHRLAPDELRRLYDILAALYRITGLVSRPTTLDGLLANVLDVVFRLLPADSGSVLFVDPADGDLVPRAARCADPKFHTVEVSETICREVVATGRGVLTRDAIDDERFRGGESVQLFGIRSALCVPIRTPRSLYGVLYLDSRSADRSFSPRDLDLLNAVGAEIGLAVENTHLLEQAVQAERLAATGQAIAGLSHYIKNVLQNIEAARVLIDAAIQDDDREGLADSWGVLDQNIELISELVLNMLSFSCEPEPHYQPCNPNGLAAEMADLLGPRAARRGTTICLELDPAMPRGLLDPAAIHRALLNLLNNAVDATGHGTVCLATHYDPDARRVRFAVTDDGPGITPRQRHDIFQAFYTTKGVGGTGLGLAVTRKLIGRLGGSIGVDSAPGRGATFTIDLPLAPPDGSP